MWSCAQCRMWKVVFMSVGGNSAGKRTCGVPSLWRRREDRREVRAQRQTMYLWGHSNRCINEKTRALCECNIPQVLVHRFKKWQKSHNQATRQRRAAMVKQKREQAAAQDRWQLGTKVWLTGPRRAKLNGAEGSIQGEENGWVLVQLDHQKGGRTVAVTHDHLGGLTPGNGNSRGSREQASSPQTRRAGAQRHDRAPVRPPAAAPHVEAAVLVPHWWQGQR